MYVIVFKHIHQITLFILLAVEAQQVLYSMGSFDFQKEHKRICLEFHDVNQQRFNFAIIITWFPFQPTNMWKPASSPQRNIKITTVAVIDIVIKIRYWNTASRRDHIHSTRKYKEQNKDTK